MFPIYDAVHDKRIALVSMNSDAVYIPCLRSSVYLVVIQSCQSTSHVPSSPLAYAYLPTLMRSYPDPFLIDLVFTTFASTRLKAWGGHYRNMHATTTTPIRVLKQGPLF